jgi:hypothetical protein
MSDPHPNDRQALVRKWRIRCHRAENAVPNTSMLDALTKAALRKSLDRIIELENQLLEAVEDIESWAGYASEYFQTKHDLAGCIAAHRAILMKDDV